MRNNPHFGMDRAGQKAPPNPEPVKMGPSTPELERAWDRAVPDMDRSLSYYLSGPMKGYPDHNWPAFTEACEILRRTGLTIVSPHEVNPAANVEAKLNPEKYPLDYLRNDIIEMLNRCQSMILMKGWPKSRGVRLELDIALSLEWPIYYYHDYRLVSFQ